MYAYQLRGCEIACLISVSEVSVFELPFSSPFNLGLCLYFYLFWTLLKFVFSFYNSRILFFNTLFEVCTILFRSYNFNTSQNLYFKFFECSLILNWHISIECCTSFFLLFSLARITCHLSTQWLLKSMVDKLLRGVWRWT